MIAALAQNSKPTATEGWYLKGTLPPDGHMTQISIPDGLFRVGRRPDINLSLPVGSVSKLHAEFVATAFALFVRDTGSTNGTFVNGNRITEDTPVDASSIQHLGSPGINWFGPSAPPAEDTLDDAFEGAVLTNGVYRGAKKSAYVPENTKVGSLAAVEIDVRHLNFFVNTFNGQSKLRARLEDSADVYDLPVSSHALHQIYHAGGAAAVNAHLPRAGQLHVRVGLARAFAAQPGKCTAMINGVNW